MSAECYVMTTNLKMSNPSQWANKIISEGFGLQLDTSYDPKKESIFGYRPCKYYNLEVGFELSYITRSSDREWFEEWEEEFEVIKSCDLCVIFSCFCEQDVEAAMVAGAVLAKASEGIYFDVDEPMKLEDVMDAARNIDAKMKKLDSF